jgi:cytochrome c oxidase cbb3-type subunit 3
MRRLAARLALAALLVALSGCEREKRPFQTMPPYGVASAPGPRGYDDNAWAVAEGKRLFRWYNCNGCHANGGGGMGPALMDHEWRYGSSPESIVATVLQGRPNGMPAFAGRIPVDQAWQIASYVRSMSGLLRSDVATSRSDSISPGQPELRRPRQIPVPGDKPPSQP